MAPPTRNQKVRQHNRDRSKKYKYELLLAMVMRAFFRKLSNRIEEDFKNNRKLVDPGLYQQELLDILEKHYKKTAVAFNTYIYERQMNQQERQQVDNQHESFFIVAMLAQLPRRVKLIINTIKKDIHLLYRNNILSLTPQDYKKLFLQRAFWRANLIAVTETQNAAELKKFVQAKYLEQNLGIVVRKTWITILDGKERQWHGDASGQTVKGYLGLFIVWDQYLLHPGDITHGATAGNICNCRCSAIYFR